MAQEVSIDINPISNPTPSRTADFVPSPQTAMVNDLIFWRNNDTQYTHQPMPVGGSPNAWVTDQIPAKLSDQDAPLGGGTASSNTVSFGSGSTQQGIPYTCKNHPDEKGILIVRNNININNVAGAAADKPQAAFAPGKPTFKVNELFIWSNNDVKEHWPAPSQQQKTAWMSQPIQPGQTSPPISIGQASAGIAYVCTIHPNETGTIVVK
jgi:plastocyanin